MSDTIRWADREAVVAAAARQLGSQQPADLLAARGQLEPAGGGGGQGVEGPADVGLDADFDVVSGVHLGRDAAEDAGSFCPVRIDPHRVELLQFVATLTITVASSKPKLT